MTIRRRTFAEVTTAAEAARLIAECNEPLAVSYTAGLLYVLPTDVRAAALVGVYQGTEAEAMILDDMEALNGEA